MGKIYEKLLEYSNTDYYPFHMPGHKRTMEGVFSYDITEIPGFDNLHNPTGIILDAMKEAAEFYGSKKTYFLINSSTCGNLSAISSVTDIGDKIIIARNCHKSVYNAAFLRKLETVYVYPEIISPYNISGSISVADIEATLKHNPDAKAVVVTSPTYEGIVSDIKSIARITKSYDVPLIVDEAHGAHLGRHPDFFNSAINCNADIVVQSLHKTLPSLTQTALLHLNGDLVSQKRLEDFLAVYQTSSPSYVLMASIDECINMMKEKGTSYFDEYISLLKQCQNRLARLKHFELIEQNNKDISKLVIYTGKSNYSGQMLFDELVNVYHIQPEMAAGEYIIAMTSVMDTKEGFERLCKALEEIDAKAVACKKEMLSINYSTQVEAVYSITEGYDAEKETISIKDAENRICAEYKYVYPPGIPVVAPGEIITKEIIKTCLRFDDKIKVIKGEL